MSARILVVEDDGGIVTMLRRGLRLAGHEVSVAPDLAGARDLWVADGRWDVVLLDVMLPDGDGLELLAERRAAGDQTPCVLVTAREEGDLHDRATAGGASAVLPKPFAYADLLALVDRLTAGA
jgi:two-component system, OmpR family, response regulator QseB